MFSHPVCNGEFEIVTIEKELTPQVEKFFKENFLRYENVCMANQISSCQEATAEMIIWLNFLLEDGISFALRRVETKEVVAISINRIMNRISEEKLVKLFSQFKSRAFEFITEYLHRVESDFNIFEKLNIDTAFEITFLSTSRDYSGRGLATILVNNSIDLARKMSTGTFENQKDLPINIRDLKPQVVCSIFSSLYTQKIGEKLAFQTVNKISHKDLYIGNKSFYDFLDKNHEFGSFAVLRL